MAPNSIRRWTARVTSGSRNPSRQVPTPLIEQLEEGGRLVVPLGASPDAEDQTLVRVIKKSGRLVREDHGACRFVPLLGRFGWEA